MQTYECLHNNVTNATEQKCQDFSVLHLYFRNVIYFLKTVTKWVKLSKQYMSGRTHPASLQGLKTHPSVHGLTFLIKQALHLQSASPVPQGKSIKHLSKQNWELKFITPLGSKKPMDSIEILDFRHTMMLSHINPCMCHNISSTRLSPSLRENFIISSFPLLPPL